MITFTDKELIKEIKERISSLDVRDDIERRAYEIALLSLEVEPDEREAYELFMEKRFGDLVDRRRAKNGDNEYMAWDMTLGWIVWQQRAGIHFSTMSQQEVKSWSHTASHSMRPVIFSRYPDRLPLTGYAQGVFRQHAKIPLRINLLTSQHDKPALRLFSLRCILSR